MNNMNNNKSSKKSTKLRVLYGLGISLGVVGTIGAITPAILAIPGVIPAKQPKVDFESGTTPGTKVLSIDASVKRISTVKLELPKGYLIDETDPNFVLEVYVHGNKLTKDTDYIISYTNTNAIVTITIKAEAMTSVDIQVKLTSVKCKYAVDCPESVVGTTLSPSTTKPKYHDQLVITCNPTNGYIFDQTILGEDGIKITVGEGESARILTSESDVVVDTDAKTITIKEGVIDGAVKVEGAITKYKVMFSADEINNPFTYIAPEGKASYKNIFDVIEVFKLQESGSDPCAEIKVADPNGEITLEPTIDYKIDKTPDETPRYRYDLIWTDKGKSKITGPVSIKFSGGWSNISWKSYQDKIILGTDSFYEFTAENDIGAKAEIFADCGDTGYVFDKGQTNKLIIPEGVTPKEGIIKMTALYDNAVTTKEVSVEKAALSIKKDGQEVGENLEIIKKVDEEPLDELVAELTPIEVPGIEYSFKSSDENIIQIQQKAGSNTAKLNCVDVVRDGKPVDIEVSVVIGGYTAISKTIHVNVKNKNFKDTKWETITEAVNKFHTDYWGASEEAKVAAMKEVCFAFGDTPYVETIDPSITDENKKIEAHLINFIGKEHTIGLKDDGASEDINHTVRIIGIAHDMQKDAIDKWALFTFESKDLVTSNTSAKASIWDSLHEGTAYIFSKSVLYKNLNNTTGGTGDYWTSPVYKQISDGSNGEIINKLKEVDRKETFNDGTEWIEKPYSTKFFILTAKEMGITNSGCAEAGSVYKYYELHDKAADRIKTPVGGWPEGVDPDTCQYWLANNSAETGYEYCAWTIGIDGNLYEASQPVYYNTGFGVSFAFCL